MRDKLILKVKRGEDLTLPESYAIYGPVEFGEQLKMTKKRDIEIEWANHAEYRHRLRMENPDPHKVNETVKDKVKDRFLKKPNSKGDERFKSPGVGTAVVKFDTSENPAEAKVITTWASETGEISMLKFASTEEAIHHLADITGRRIKVASLRSYFDVHAGIRSPQEIEAENKGAPMEDLAGAFHGNYNVLYDEYIRKIKLAQEMEKYLDKIYDHEKFGQLGIDLFKG